MVVPQTFFSSQMGNCLGSASKAETQPGSDRQVVDDVNEKEDVWVVFMIVCCPCGGPFSILAFNCLAVISGCL